MANDATWDSARNILVAIGSTTAVSGWLGVAPESVGPFVDQALTLIGSALTLATLAWTFYVKFRTKAVPIATAMRADVPTVSPITGAIKTGRGA